MGGGQGPISLFAGALLLDIVSANALSSCIGFIGQGSAVLRHRSSVRWDVVSPYIVTGVPCSFFGALLFSRYLHESAVRTIIACCCLAFIVLRLCPLRRLCIRKEFLLPGLGAVNGLAGGFGFGGLLRLPCLLSLDLTNDEVVGTSAVIAFLLNIVRMPVLLWYMPWSCHFLLFLGAAAVLVPLGVWAGSLLLKVMSVSFFRTMLLCVLAAEAFWFLLF
jgi:uncharacterized membrane protein YfcA